jgi:hypothetical protein
VAHRRRINVIANEAKIALHAKPPTQRKDELEQAVKAGQSKAVLKVALLLLRRSCAEVDALIVVWK